MKLANYMLEEEVTPPEARRPPPYLMWLPPSGSPVECPNLDLAQRAAEKMAGRHPGAIVAVYQLVGWAYQPIKTPNFVPMAPEGEPRLLSGSAPEQKEPRGLCIAKAMGGEWCVGRCQDPKDCSAQSR